MRGRRDRPIATVSGRLPVTRRLLSVSRFVPGYPIEGDWTADAVLCAGRMAGVTSPDDRFAGQAMRCPRASRYVGVRSRRLATTTAPIPISTSTARPSGHSAAPLLGFS